LHRVQFGGAMLRWLYFLLGGAGCVMLASGMQVWVAKRAKKIELASWRSGYGFVRTLNVGVVAGMPLASIALLWINRLLPAQMAERASWEARGFCIVWLLAALWSMARLHHGKPWRDLFAMTAALLLALPLINAITYPFSSLLHSVIDRDWTLASVDLSAFALGLGFGWLAWKSGLHASDRPSRVRATAMQAHTDEANA
jgi:uncharacterized iron-regulated membrane protein